jgi:nucleotide-binding universal stress UspA family protein
MHAKEQSSTTAQVIVGVDGSESSRVALRWAFDYALQRGAALHAVHAWTYPVSLSFTGEYLPPNTDLAADALAVLRQVVQDELGVNAPFVQVEAPFGTPGLVLAQRSHGAELLVVGAPGGDPLTHLPIGSTSAYAVQHRHCRVVVCRPPSSAAPGTRRSTEAALTV